jgi:RecB family endonuclease NucS
VLKDFLIKNWEKTELARTLDLVEEDGELATEVQTGVGNIDILAQEKKTKAWVVIELKKRTRQ